MTEEKQGTARLTFFFFKTELQGKVIFLLGELEKCVREYEQKTEKVILILESFLFP